MNKPTEDKMKMMEVTSTKTSVQKTAPKKALLEVTSGTIKKKSVLFNTATEQPKNETAMAKEMGSEESFTFGDISLADDAA